MEPLKRLYLRVHGALAPSFQGKLDSALTSLYGKVTLLRLVLAKVRRRFGPRRLFVGWLLLGDREAGASRVRGLLPHAYLRSKGIHSVVVAQRLATLSMRRKDMVRIANAGFDVVVFESVAGQDAEDLARSLRAVGTKTVFAVGELRRTGMPGVVDWVVLASEGLEEDLTGGRSDKTSVIESTIDGPPGLCKDYSRPHSGESIRVVWVGNRENLHLLEPVREALRSPLLTGFELITISRGEGVTFQWHRNRVWKQLIECDIAVLPYDESDWYWNKPNTRMTMLKALGLPIVASPIPSHLATLTHGRGCYFARDAGEWVECLQALSDPERRREMGLAERAEVLEKYGLEAIGGRWLELLERLARDRPPATEHMRATAG